MRVAIDADQDLVVADRFREHPASGPTPRRERISLSRLPLGLEEAASIRPVGLCPRTRSDDPGLLILGQGGAAVGPETWPAGRSVRPVTVTHRCEDRLLHGEDPGFECGDLYQNLRIAGQEPFVLGVGEISFLGGMFERQPVAVGGAVAGQQDQGCGVRSLGAEREIQQDERERIERPHQQHDVGREPHPHDGRLDQDEPPAAHEARDTVGDSRTEGCCREYGLVHWMAVRALIRVLDRRNDPVLPAKTGCAHVFIEEIADDFTGRRTIAAPMITAGVTAAAVTSRGKPAK